MRSLVSVYSIPGRAAEATAVFSAAGGRRTRVVMLFVARVGRRVDAGRESVRHEPRVDHAPAAFADKVVLEKLWVLV